MTTLKQIAEITIKASEIREASYVQGTYRYRLTHSDAADQALEAAGVTDKAARTLVYYLVYGEGCDVARGMLNS